MSKFPDNIQNEIFGAYVHNTRPEIIKIVEDSMFIDVACNCSGKEHESVTAVVSVNQAYKRD